MTIKPEVHERVIAALETGGDKSLRQIAEEVGGVSHETIRKIAREVGHEVPAHSLAVSKCMKKLHADPIFAARHAAVTGERMRKLHADPVFAAKNAAAASERMKKLNADPIFAAAHSERMKKQHADPVFAAAHRDRMKRRHAASRLLKSMGVIATGNNSTELPISKAKLALRRGNPVPGTPTPTDH